VLLGFRQWDSFASDYCIKEPSGLDRQDGKCPDGLTLMSCGGRPLIWDVTVVSPLVASYVDKAATNAGKVADMASTRKTEKYSSLSSTYLFEPIAMENLGAFSLSTLNELSDLVAELMITPEMPERQRSIFIPTHFCHDSVLRFCAFARH